MSLTAETPTTMARGMKITGNPPEMLMSGIICMIPMIRK